jgi:adenosylcobinamide-GDP ribazoletransferase
MSVIKTADHAVGLSSDAAEGPFIAREWKAFVTAVEFLTRVPLSSSAVAKTPAELRRCPRYFALVGGLIGLFTAALAGVFSVVWPPWLAALVALAAEARLTGALHEDGVADFCDAFGGGWTRDDVLTVLKDSRIGSFGALGLFLAIAIRAGAIGVLIDREGVSNWLGWGSAIVVSASVARWLGVLAVACIPPVPLKDSTVKDLRSEPSWWFVCGSALWTIPPLICFSAVMPFRCILAAAVLAVAVWWFLRMVRVRINCITGDCCGCLIYMGQIIILLAAAVRIKP